MASKVSTIDAAGEEHDFVVKPFLVPSQIVSIDARNRNENQWDSPADFEISLPVRLKEVRAVRLRQAHISVPEDYDDPAIIMHVRLNGTNIGRIIGAHPAEATPVVTKPDASADAFAEFCVDSRDTSPDPRFICYQNWTGHEIMHRWPSTPFASVQFIHITLTDYNGTALNIGDENSAAPPGTVDRVWFQFEFSCAR